MPTARCDGHGPLDHRSAKPIRGRCTRYLLDLDDDLAEEFDIRSRVSARQLATVKLLEAEVGDGDLSNWFDVARGRAWAC